MINRTDLDLIFQLIEGMNDIALKIDEAQKNKDTRTLELAKRETLEFQRKLARELKELKGVEK